LGGQNVVLGPAGTLVRRRSLLLVRSLIGILALLVAFGPLITGTAALRRRLLPGWSGPPAWLAEFTTILTACLVTILALGVIGWYSIVFTTIMLAGIGVAMLWAANRLPEQPRQVPVRQPERLGRYAKVAAVVALACMAATWGARTYIALNHGMVSIDSLWYHLPQAARFADLHKITFIYHDVENLSGFYPINSELIHSLGMVFLGNDFLSMILNVGWGVVGLLAAWCIGRPRGMGAVCVAGLAVLFCAPAFVGTQAGAAHDDLVGVSLFLVAAALLVSGNPNRVTGNPIVLALAAMPVGFALGTKWTLIPMAVAFSLGVILLIPRGTRVRLIAMWLAIVGVLGSFSYVRNLIQAGNPLPNIDVKFGPIGWTRKVPALDGTDKIASFLFDRTAWEKFFLPGFNQWFGYAWWAVMGLALLGMILAIARGPGSLTRMLGAIAVVAFIGFLYLPQALLLFNQPYFFAPNLRYGTAAIAFGLVLLPVTPLFARRRIGWILPGAYAAIVLVMQLDPTLWPTELRDLRWESPPHGADAVSGLVIGIIALGVGLVIVLSGHRLRRRMPKPRPRVDAVGTGDRDRGRRGAVLVGSAIALVALSFVVLGVQQYYLDRRYDRPDSPTPFIPAHFEAWQWARDVHDERIGYQLPALAYPLDGNQLTNVVEPLPTATAVAKPGDPPPDLHQECLTFVHTVNTQRYTALVLFGSLAPAVWQANSELIQTPPPGTLEKGRPELKWLEADPAASQVLRADTEAVFRINGKLDPDRCPKSS
jgi:hypothetical protein